LNCSGKVSFFSEATDSGLLLQEMINKIEKATKKTKSIRHDL
jgi:hypothetical protein